MKTTRRLNGFKQALDESFKAPWKFSCFPSSTLHRSTGGPGMDGGIILAPMCSAAPLLLIQQILKGRPQICGFIALLELCSGPEDFQAKHRAFPWAPEGSSGLSHSQYRPSLTSDKAPIRTFSYFSLKQTQGNGEKHPYHLGIFTFLLHFLSVLIFFFPQNQLIHFFWTCTFKARAAAQRAAKPFQKNAFTTEHELPIIEAAYVL